MENLVTYTDYKTTSADTDMHARLRPGAMLNILIQSAIASTDNLGFGFKDLKKPEKLHAFVEGEITEIRSSCFDIDLNKHVTATRCVDWMMDTLPLEYQESTIPVQYP